MRTEARPWGEFDVLYEGQHTWLKRIFIAPGQSLSYQYHLNRAEFWKPETPGVWAEVGGKTFELYEWAHAPVQIWPGVRHRLFNPGQTEVRLLEWATGTPTEDDIVRLSDLYGR